MQKLFKSCHKMDKRCYTKYDLNEDILMEHAAQGMATYIKEYFPKGSTILIVCGSGNNGGDGVVLARQLYSDYTVSLYVPFGTSSPIAKLQLKRTLRLGITLCDKIHEADIIVDALFGAGLNRELDEATQILLHQLNTLTGFKLSCDVPTGVGSDGRLMPFAFKADVTVTMGALKESLYLDETKEVTGEIICTNLGVSRQMYELHSDTFVLERDDLKLPSRKQKSTHKGSFGHAAVFCGKKEGAGIIAAMAASCFGVGLTTLVTCKSISPPPFLMHENIVPKNTTALAIGMGLGDHFEAEFLQKHIIDSRLPIVLDADAFYSEALLGILSQKEREVVITPHPKEFTILWERLTGESLSVAQIQSTRFDMVRRFNKKFPHVTLLLKGANMLMVQKNKLYVNPLGNNKLSKGGSGDVLSGLIVSLLAQGYTSLEATIQGSLALTLAAEKYDGASYAMLPTDLIENLSMLESMI
ncbi:MAG: NAD(P)H-hydrate dehydratase [Sulfurovum sp.]|nr:NAD(P)H-hydrate dehydratase [Sulfurovum sp.]